MKFHTLRPFPRRKISLVAIRCLLFAVFVVGSFGSGVPMARAQTKTTPDKLQSLNARMGRANSGLQQALQRANAYPVFRVQGRIEGATDNGALLLNGTAIGANAAADSALGWARTTQILAVLSYRSSGVVQEDYNDFCTYHTERMIEGVRVLVFTPAPQDFFDAVKAVEQYRAIIESTQSEINYLESVATQQQRKATQERLARQQEQVRLSTLQSRRSLFNAEVGQFWKLSQAAEAASAGQSALLAQSARRALVLVNQWGAKGLETQKLETFAVTGLVRAAVLDAEAGKLSRAAEFLDEALGLERQTGAPDAVTRQPNRALIRVSNLPSTFARTQLQANSTLVTRLGTAWSAQMPNYLKRQTNEGQLKAVVLTTRTLSNEVFRTAAQAALLAPALNAINARFGAYAVETPLPSSIPPPDSSSPVPVPEPDPISLPIWSSKTRRYWDLAASPASRTDIRFSKSANWTPRAVSRPTVFWLPSAMPATPKPGNIAASREEIGKTQSYNSFHQ